MYYKGQTGNLKDRIRRHNSGLEKATSKGKPWKLVWCTKKEDRLSAVCLERKLKNLTRERLERFILKHLDGFAGPDVP